MGYYIQKNRDGYAGFCAILNNTINMCSLYYQNFKDIDLSIDVYDLNEIFEFKNSVSDNDQNFWDFWTSSNFDNSSNAHTICDLEKIRFKNFIYKKFFKLKNQLHYENESKKFINEKTLGLQIRGTDKKSEVPPPNIDNILKHVEIMMGEKCLESIFLATDDFFYQERLVQEYGDIVKFRDKKISYDGNPIHFVEDRSQLNLDVMTDVYLLSNTKHFLYCFSNVSYSALVLGSENFSKIDCINLKK